MFYVVLPFGPITWLGLMHAGGELAPFGWEPFNADFVYVHTASKWKRFRIPVQRSLVLVFETFSPKRIKVPRFSIEEKITGPSFGSAFSKSTKATNGGFKFRGCYARRK